jgi:hypothetical protein
MSHLYDMREGHWFGFRELVSELGEEEEVLAAGTHFCTSVAFPSVLYTSDGDGTMETHVPHIRGNSQMSGMAGIKEFEGRRRLSALCVS